jgi:H+/Cl- antiporter ClcA
MRSRQPQDSAIVGTWVFFTAVGRAPVTGTVLIVELRAGLYAALANPVGVFSGDGDPHAV